MRFLLSWIHLCLSLPKFCLYTYRCVHFHPLVLPFNLFVSLTFTSLLIGHTHILMRTRVKMFLHFATIIGLVGQQFLLHATFILAARIFYFRFHFRFKLSLSLLIQLEWFASLESIQTSNLFFFFIPILFFSVFSCVCFCVFLAIGVHILVNQFLFLLLMLCVLEQRVY